MNTEYDVFISYHGGQGDDNKSSYGMAEKLYKYLESYNIKCFLCKKENANDFYDAINSGILHSKHFILVACDPKMLSQWVEDEVKQFDGLRKNGQKPNSIIAACIFGDITEKDLYNFNPLFATKDIIWGEKEFEKFLKRVLPYSRSSDVIRPQTASNDVFIKPFDKVSRTFLSNTLKNYEDINIKEDNEKLTTRLKCMIKTPVPENCSDFVEVVYESIKNSSSRNLLKVMGQSGSQKSYLLQLLYVFIENDSKNNNFDPIYIHCEDLRENISKNQADSEKYIDNLFVGLQCEKNRVPLFIIDGIYDIVFDKYRLDFILKKKMDEYFPDSKLIIGMTQVFSENKIRLNKSTFIRSQYDKIINLFYVSLYDKQKSILYLSTLRNLPYNCDELYDLLNKCGLLSINEQIVKTFCAGYEYDESSNIMEIFETELLNYLDGDTESLKKSAELMFNFAYGDEELDYDNPLFVKIINKVCHMVIYLNCLVAIHFLNNLERYGKTQDFSFFNVILPKEVTRFVVVKSQANTKYEELFVSLGQHYNEMTLLGKSEMSFFLGRVKNARYKEKAIDLLKKYYEESKESIKKYNIDIRYYDLPYSFETYKQMLFLLRGISVSLIYCGSKEILYEYIHSLIDDDLSNSINRGFHLEYYGDKKYLPNRQTLDYEDNPKTGERTLRILCNSIDIHMNSSPIPLSTLLEVFTVVSLLQVRIQQDRNTLSYNLSTFVERGLKTISQFFEEVNIEDNVIKNFFAMAEEDLKGYLINSQKKYQPELDICNTYLNASTVKRTGWVMQNINEPESIVEHMYSCWFIGLIFLPNICNTISGYNKNSILNMLLIHDLAEKKLSDIPKYEKKIKYPDYETKENRTMLSILLKGTYDNIDTMPQFVSAWDEWYNQNSENSKIAKDIDTIQAIYQFLTYKLQFPDNFDTERTKNWINELNCIQTTIGKNIAKKIIVNNNLFFKIISEYPENIPQELK